jgi:hypothetical protein
MHRFIRISILLLLGTLFINLKPILAAPAGLQPGEVSSVTEDTYASRRWIAVYNRTGTTLSDYPLEITSLAGDGFDHAALVAAGKAQADGDDLRVEVDGSEVDRWIIDADNTSTKVWVNLSLQPGQMAILAEGFGSGDALSSIVVDDTGGFPASGLLFDTVSGEAFIYTSLDPNHFLGVTRAARATFRGNGSIGDEIVWIEKDVYLLYGNAALDTLVVNDHFKPAFEMALSSNIRWDYDYFGEDDGLRTAAWSHRTIQSEPVFYSGYLGGYSDPWSRVGVLVGASDTGAWQIYNPCGITHAEVSGSYRREGNAWTPIGMKSSIDGSNWTTFNSIGTPLDTLWHDWNSDRDTIVGALYLRLNVIGPPQYVANRMDLDEATLTLDSNGTPGILLTPERTPSFLPLLLRP